MSELMTHEIVQKVFRILHVDENILENPCKVEFDTIPNKQSLIWLSLEAVFIVS